MRVLVAEPDGDSAFTLAAWLERRGHRVTLAGTGAAACRVADAPVEIAFVSQRLPDMSGVELARRLRATASDLRIIAIACGPPDVDEAFDATLRLPLTSQALREVLGDA